MMTFREKYGPWALIAGASEGLGAEYASQIAARGLKVFLVARREEPLRKLAEQIRRSQGVEVRTLALDLGDRANLARLTVATEGLEIGLLVYNAAYAPNARFLEEPLEDKLRALAVNTEGPLTLAHAYSRQMAGRGRGGIILMSSFAGLLGTGGLSVYAATKAFNAILAESLWAELKSGGVEVLGCVAGATRTPGYLRNGPAKAPGLLLPEQVVRGALAALGRGPRYLPGWVNKLAAVLLTRILPRSAAIRIMAKASPLPLGPPRP